jgi:seryl-tRNA synthetase
MKMIMLLLKGMEITSQQIPVDHLDITSKIDTELAAKLSGSRFSVLKGDIAKLQRALISFMLDTAIKNGYEEYYVPFMAN